MSDARDQADRVLAAIDRPEDPAGESPMDPAIPPDRTRQFNGTQLSRMKRSWAGDEAIAMGDINYAAEQAIEGLFGRAIRLIDRLRSIAQTPIEINGEIQYHLNGKPKVRVDEYGDPIEDWSRLGPEQAKNFLFVINTSLFEWEAVKVRLWGEAMFAKGLWEQAFSYGFRVRGGEAISGKPTIDDKTQMGHLNSAQDRFFGIFCAVLSRRADVLVMRLDRIQWMLEKTLDS